MTKEKINSFVMSQNYRSFILAVNKLSNESPVSIIDNFQLITGFEEIPLSELLDQNSDIINRIESGAMSYGALTKKAHSTIAIAENIIGGTSNTGEGGEAEVHYTQSHRLANARTKQIASARFGVTTEYLLNIPKNGYIEIKISQGAKPGEGGQLPAGKVTVQIASHRGSMPKTDLISPPPHHDIYSIEDLQQLIYDLKSSNNKVCVKLCSSQNIDTIAIGVAKGGANKIKIAGNSGGTGAAMVTSIKDTGLPPELG